MSPLFRSAQRRGFTLVELLTVVGIIALLMGILMPALSKARMQAKRTACAAIISSIERGLEMFKNDFEQYPDSQYRPDPIHWGTLPPTPPTGNLTGSHWLARALAGHDFLGVDTKGRSLNLLNEAPASVPVVDLDPNGPMKAERKGLYIDAKKAFAADNDSKVFSRVWDRSIGRFLPIDNFGYPILYYRANSRAQQPFSYDDMSVYRLRDNVTITGYWQADSQPPTKYTWDPAIPERAPWDFAGTGMQHGLGVFGSTVDPRNRGAALDPVTNTVKGQYFTEYMYNNSAFTATSAGGGAGTVSAANSETYVMISSGPDGIFGTTDDLNNFK